MKKGMVILLSLLLLVSCFGFVASAEELSAAVTVTIADQGALKLIQQTVTVTDCDADNALTINDALYAAHEAKYEGGAAVGYATAQTQYGLSMVTLWGNTSGNFGYYVNNASAWSLVDPVKDGDTVYAYVYTDGTTFSDMYTYFDAAAVATEAGKAVTLTLSGAGFDQNWSPIVVPVAGATITVDGKATEFVTDTEGKVTVTLEAGVHTVSATSATQVLVPPVCVATVTAAKEEPKPENQEPEQEPAPAPEKNPQTGVEASLLVIVLGVAFVAMSLFGRKADAK